MFSKMTTKKDSKFKPKCMATAIGSMPHTNVEKACKLVLENLPEAPAWPQLPKISFKENMYAQFSQAIPGLLLDLPEKKIWVDTAQDLVETQEKFYQAYLDKNLEAFAISQDYAQGFYALLEEWSKQSPPEQKFFKGQVTGPITMGLGLKNQENKATLYDDTFIDIIIKTVAMKAGWQRERIKQAASAPAIKTIIFFDEPYLQCYGSAVLALNREQIIDYLDQCLAEEDRIRDESRGMSLEEESTKEKTVFKGVHCCGNTDWSILMDTKVNIIHFDAYNFMESMTLYPQKLKEFLERGGMLAWGIIPSTSEVKEETVSRLKDQFEQGLKLLTREGLDEEILLNQALIAPSCGLGSLKEEEAEKALTLTRGLSESLREKYFGGNL